MVPGTVDYMYDSVTQVSVDLMFGLTTQGYIKKGIVLLMFVGFVFLSTFYYYMKLKCVTDMFATSSQTKISPVYLFKGSNSQD